MSKEVKKITNPSTGSGQAPSTGSGQAPSTGSGQAPSANTRLRKSSGGQAGQTPVARPQVRERIILGLDPGTNIMGYGVILVEGSALKLLQFGVIRLSKFDSHELRLKKIFERVLGLVDEFSPDEVALEAPFYGKNVQSMLKLGRAQGVAMAAALNRGIPIFEYAPKKVKQSVTGNGNASKEQVAKMLMQLFAFKELPKLLDASDALGVAVCHCYQNGKSQSKVKSWDAFLKANPGRVKG